MGFTTFIFQIAVQAINFYIFIAESLDYQYFQGIRFKDECFDFHH